MKFCEKCSNLLIPRNGKLYCKACDDKFEFSENEGSNYKIIKQISHSEEDLSPIIVKKSYQTEKISKEDRRAYEDYFNVE